MRSRNVEKRSEPRVTLQGAVRILWDDSGAPCEVKGRLVDYSRRGFRAAHQGSVLTKGQVVHFRHPKASGMARVVWNRINEGITETGFLVL